MGPYLLDLGIDSNVQIAAIDIDKQVNRFISA